MKTAKEIVKSLEDEFHMGSPKSKVNRQCKKHSDLILLAMEEYANQSKNLLEKYIKHVGQCEGIDFIDTHYSDVKFTEQEYEVLRNLSEKP